MLSMLQAFYDEKIIKEASSKYPPPKTKQISKT
jgi:hypothetical protein